MLRRPLTALAALLLAAPALAQQAETPRVTATGTCVAEVVPDRATILVTVTRRGADAARVSADATAAFNAFRREVDALRLPDAVLAGSGLSIQRIVETGAGQRPVFRGYIASAGLQVESSDPARLAEIVPLAAGSRIDDVGEIELSVSERQRRAAELGCLPKASADARTRAAALAEGIGMGLGPALMIADPGQGVRPPRPYAAAPAMLRMAAPAQPPPDVPTGVQRIEVSTRVTFALEARP